MNQKKIQSNLMLVLAASIWGVAFVAQSVGMQYVGPFTFNGIRCVLGGIVLIPCIYFLNHKSIKKDKTIYNDKDLIIGGIWCGIVLFISSSLQQIGLKYTTVGKAGFITALYIIIVPILGIFLKKKVSLQILVSVVIATVGMYLLCVTESLSVNIGDILIFLCAAAFSVHILLIDYFSPKVDGVKLSCIQFFICGIISFVPMFFLEKPGFSEIIDAWLPICYAGILSCGVAYTFQILAQKHTPPVIASLILSMESVISAFAGWLILGQVMSVKERTGSFLVFCAIILAQIKKINVKERLIISEEES